MALPIAENSLCPHPGWGLGRVHPMILPNHGVQSLAPPNCRIQLEVPPNWRAWLVILQSRASSLPYHKAQPAALPRIVT